MQFLVFSDSHGYADRMATVLRRSPDVKSIIFLGDGLRDLDVLRPLFPHHTFRAVRGNCDPLALDTPTADILDLYGIRIWLTHGHLLSVKGGMGAAVSRAMREGARALLYGHTHIPDATYLSREGLYLCNPGSIGRPAVGAPCFGRLDILPDGTLSFSHGTL